MTRTLILALFIVAPGCDTAEAPKPANNTKVNERDRGDATKTPIDQSNEPADLKITASIRKSVIADETLSMSAKNIKIITSGGIVTLRGPVTSTNERTKIANLSRGTASVKRVDDQLEIAPE